MNKAASGGDSHFKILARATISIYHAKVPHCMAARAVLRRALGDARVLGSFNYRRPLVSNIKLHDQWNRDLLTTLVSIVCLSRHFHRG